MDRSHRCIFRSDSHCSHPMLFGPASDERCAPCEKYKGPPRGLGDVVHSIAKATGIAQVVEKVAGKDCGCAKRRAAMNAAIPLADPEPENR